MCSIFFFDLRHVCMIRGHVPTVPSLLPPIHQARFSNYFFVDEDYTRVVAAVVSHKSESVYVDVNDWQNCAPQ
jgi:hypothetical protein